MNVGDAGSSPVVAIAVKNKKYFSIFITFYGFFVHI